MMFRTTGLLQRGDGIGSRFAVFPWKTARDGVGAKGVLPVPTSENRAAFIVDRACYSFVPTHEQHPTAD